MARRSPLRPPGFDELGLKRALADRMLPSLVAAMAFLAALALAGWVGAAALAQHWQQGAGAALTVQVPQPSDPAAGGAGAAGDGGTREDAVLALLRAAPGVAGARALSAAELDAVLRPWLGAGPGRLALALPGVIAVRLADPLPDEPALNALAAQLRQAAPGTLIEQQGVWIDRLLALVRSLQASAGAALLVVVAVAAAVIAVATRAGLAARREAIEIVHGLGATDGYIAARFAARATLLAAAGGVAGGLAALPVLLALAHLAAPFAASGAGAASGGIGPGGGAGGGIASGLPPALWLLLPGLPLAAAAIGFLTAQVTVRRWLRQLP